MHASVWWATSSFMGKTATLFVVPVLNMAVIIVPTVTPFSRSVKQWWFLGHDVYYSMVIIIRMNPRRKTFSWNSFIVISSFRPHFISSICHFLLVSATVPQKTHSITSNSTHRLQRWCALPHLFMSFLHSFCSLEVLNTLRRLRSPPQAPAAFPLSAGAPGSGRLASRRRRSAPRVSGRAAPGQAVPCRAVPGCRKMAAREG